MFDMFKLQKKIANIINLDVVHRYALPEFYVCKFYISNIFLINHYYINDIVRLLNDINWRDVKRKNVVNDVDMSSLRAPWQNGPYENKHSEQQHVERQDATDIQQNTMFCVFRIVFFSL